MRSSHFRRVLLTLFAGVGTLASCGALSQYITLKEDDAITTFEAPISGKQIVRIGFAMAMDWKPLIAALNARFPSKQFIYDFDVTSGVNLSADGINEIVKKNNYDFVVTNYWNAPTIGADISGESFLKNYLSTTLSAIADKGHIYGLPLPTSASGIFYNKTLFQEKGWSMPSSTDDLASLYSTIAATGIRPFDSCFKYESSLVRVLEGMVYDELLSSPEGMEWYSNLLEGKANFAPYATPMFTLAKHLFDEKVFAVDSFNASLTTMRKDFFSGKLAMIDYSSDIYGLALTDKCPFELGFAPYPSSTGKNASVLYSSSVVLLVPSAIEQDKTRYAFDTSVMDYLSTSEGQDALLTGWSGVPSLKQYTGNNPLYNTVSSYIKNGTYHAILDFASDQSMVKPLKSLIKTTVLSIFNGTSIAEAMSALDTDYKATLTKGVSIPTYNNIATATDDFSVLATSYYLADKMKAATGADFALVPSGGFYRANMAYIKKGDVTTDSRLFYQKGIAAKDYITTYTLTGAKLRTLLERPIINGNELDQFVAASGLKMSYAPWLERGKRIETLSLEDGSAFDENKTYKVAAYAGVIDKSYLETTLDAYKDLADPETFAINQIKTDKTISPNLKSRLTLDWTKVAPVTSSLASSI